MDFFADKIKKNVDEFLAGLIKQNDSRLPDAIRTYGCNFRAVSAAAEIVTGQHLSVDQILQLYDRAIRDGSMMPNCWCRLPHRITQTALGMLGAPAMVYQIGNITDDQWRSWQGNIIDPRPNSVYYSTLRWQSDQQHFTLSDSHGREVWDPWLGSIKKEKILSVILYEIRS